MATFTKPRELFVIATLGWMTVYNCQPAVAQYMPRFGAAFKTLVGKGEEKKVVVEKQEIPAPKVTEQNYAQVQLAIGDSLAKEGNFKGAQSAYEAAIRNDPSLAGAYHHLARLQEKLGSGDESKVLFQRAHELDPNNAEIICDYGYWCYLRKDWMESGRHFQRALQLNPDLKRAHNNLGLLYARTGRPDEALKQFAMAGLNEADARANLGFVYLSERRMPEAKAELQRAVESNPGSAKARDVLASLDRVVKTGQPIAVQPTTARLPAVQPQSSPQNNLVPPERVETSPYAGIADTGAVSESKLAVPPALPTPYVAVAREDAAGHSKVARPATEPTATHLPAVKAPSSKQFTRLPEPVAEPSPYLTVLRDEAPVAPSVATPAQVPTPYVTVTPVAPSAVTPAQEPTPYVTVAPVQVAPANRPGAPAPEPTPYVTVARVGATGRAKDNARTVEQTPYLSNSTASGAPQNQIVAPASNTPGHVAVASKQVELPSVGRPTSVEDSPAPQFSPVLSDYPHWDTPVAPASAVGFTQKVEQQRVRPNVAPSAPASTVAPAAAPHSLLPAPAPAPPTSKSTVRFVPNARR